MKTITSALLLIMLIPSLVFAGEIYGSIKMGKRPVRGVKVEIKSTRKTPYSATTDRHGSYIIYVKEKGKCTLKLYIKEGKKVHTPTIKVYSSKSSAHYNLILEKNKKGIYSLRRK
ncbi:MAG: hypothetical protein ACE5IR_22045 [bacterium]